ncbi:TetR/AcrR family transcriptional regulator [Actinocorallia populi]|uniref:TetR/AcrR family transcriptional regulator n=1 Tax=Actinocorallia populi TaxID=2079200 RepID=UPI001E44385D|nr:TetR/AcrR family transcriptional regulator [Actinocorallia populi]
MPHQQPPDRRVHRSRTALETALLELIGEHDLARISVLDITRRAGVNRSTFYEHYGSVDDLAASACAAMFDELIAVAPVLGGHHGPGGRELAADALTAVFSHVAEHARLYGALLGAGGSAYMINHMHERLTASIRTNLDRADDRRARPADPAGSPHGSSAALLAGILLGGILDWLRHGCPGTPRQTSATTLPLLHAAASAAGFPPFP